MEELKNYLETVVAVAEKHISEDIAVMNNDPKLREFYRGRLAIERNDLEVFKKIADMVNKL